MSGKLAFFSIIFLTMIVNLILFVFFGQKTVRKLRKNSATKDALGIEFFSGYDIVNVMAALALPKKIAHRLNRSPLAALHADSDLLKENTTRFDLIFARVIFMLWGVWVLSLLIFIFMEKF